MKNVIITGASGGIGSAIAEYFSQNGFGVCLHYNKSEQSAKATADTIIANGGRAVIFGGDLTSFEIAEELVRFANKELGDIDVLVNNAGIAQQKLFCDITDSDYDNMMSVNLKSCFNMSKAVLPLMINKKSGSIINISSMWGLVGGSCEVHYSAAKAGMIGMTKALAKEVGPSGITVNCVAPGVIDTKMNSNLTDDDKRQLIDETPLCKIGTPVDVAKAVYFFATQEFVTGQVLAVDGGITV